MYKNLDNNYHQSILLLKKELRKLKEEGLQIYEGISTISISCIKSLANHFNIPAKEVEIVALQENISPSRYLQNFNTISIAEQIVLLKSTVAVIGCGGLGGNIIELLARLGVGTIIVADEDIFKESNINRQNFCIEDNFDKGKAESIVSRIKQINSSIRIQAHSQYINTKNVGSIIEGADVVVDALDNISARFVLENACKELNIPFVHGAINGFYGQVTTIYPVDKGLSAIYGLEEKYRKTPVSNQVSVLSFVPSLIASLQTAEVLKILIKKDYLLRNKLLLVNLESTDFNIVEII